MNSVKTQDFIVINDFVTDLAEAAAARVPYVLKLGTATITNVHKFEVNGKEHELEEVQVELKDGTQFTHHSTMCLMSQAPALGIGKQVMEEFRRQINEG